MIATPAAKPTWRALGAEHRRAGGGTRAARLWIAARKARGLRRSVARDSEAEQAKAAAKTTRSGWRETARHRRERSGRASAETMLRAARRRGVRGGRFSGRAPLDQSGESGGHRSCRKKEALFQDENSKVRWRAAAAAAAPRRAASRASPRPPNRACREPGRGAQEPGEEDELGAPSKEARCGVEGDERDPHEAVEGREGDEDDAAVLLMVLLAAPGELRRGRGAAAAAAAAAEAAGGSCWIVLHRVLLRCSAPAARSGREARRPRRSRC